MGGEGQRFIDVQGIRCLKQLEHVQLPSRWSWTVLAVLTVPTAQSDHMEEGVCAACRLEQPVSVSSPLDSPSLRHSMAAWPSAVVFVTGSKAGWTGSVAEAGRLLISPNMFVGVVWRLCVVACYALAAGRGWGWTVGRWEFGVTWG